MTYETLEQAQAKFDQLKANYDAFRKEYSRAETMEEFPPISTENWERIYETSKELGVMLRLPFVQDTSLANKISGLETRVKIHINKVKRSASDRINAISD